MSSSTIYLGLDVHKDSITVAVLPAGAAAPSRVDRLSSDLAKLRRYCERLSAQGEVRACYEASGAGYVVHRAMTRLGVRLRGHRTIAHSHATRRPAQALVDTSKAATRGHLRTGHHGRASETGVRVHGT
jgi:hypothetical protein